MYLFYLLQFFLQMINYSLVRLKGFLKYFADFMWKHYLSITNKRVPLLKGDVDLTFKPQNMLFIVLLPL